MKTLLIKLIAIVLFIPAVCLAEVKQNSPELVVHLLDYLANDYAGAVKNGKVISQFEYDEQLEFVQIVETNSNGTTKLKTDVAFMEAVERLGILIRTKGSPDEVSKLARDLQQDAIRLSGIEVAPTRWPDISSAVSLYKMNCASCHGELGAGNGVAGSGLDPKPANFLDPELAWNSSPYKFYNTIRLGVPGTGMSAYSHLSDNEVWALAFYLKSLAHAENSGKVSDEWNLSLKDVATMSDGEIAEKWKGKPGGAKGAIASLRTRRPDSNNDPIAVAENLLNESFRAASAGQFGDAHKLGVRAYLEGVEPIEPKLQANAPALVGEIEALMIEYRYAVSQKRSIQEIESKKTATLKKMDEIRGVLSENTMTPAVAFGAAFSIFLREGFEAILIIVVLISILKAMNQPLAVKWVHVGWVTAVSLGVLAWFASGLLLSMSGMSRELMEGAIALFAVVVLIYVGFWLHRYSEIRRWKVFLEEKLKHGLKTGSYLGIALVSFMAVFREAFEVVLFLRAIWIDLDPSGQTVASLGIGSSLIILAVLGYFVIHQSRKVPLGLLFQICSWTMIVLAVVLAGKGIRSLQEAGLVCASSLDWLPRIDLLGIYPNVQTLSVQLVTIFIFCSLLLGERYILTAENKK